MTTVVKKIVLSLATAAILGGLSVPTAFAADRAVQAALSGQKGTARSIMLKRGVWGHFRAMDNNKDWSLSFPEMDQYFTAMHVAFDVNNDGMVARSEAPKIMLKYSLSGRSFPVAGLSLGQLRGQLQTLFVKLDRNRNSILSVRELS